MRTFLSLLLLLSLATSALAAPASDVETLRPFAGVKIGKIKYVRSETRRDPDLEKAIVQQLQMKNADVAYFYNWVGLNGRKANQAIVVMHGPQVCGNGGCPAFIFNRTQEGFICTARFTLVRTPVVMTEERHSGWRSLVFEVSGGGMKAAYHKLDFNGRTYPSNPSTAPTLKPGTTLSGTAFIADPITPDAGIKLHLP